MFVLSNLSLCQRRTCHSVSPLYFAAWDRSGSLAILAAMRRASWGLSTNDVRRYQLRRSDNGQHRLLRGFGLRFSLEREGHESPRPCRPMMLKP